MAFMPWAAIMSRMVASQPKLYSPSRGSKAVQEKMPTERELMPMALAMRMSSFQTSMSIHWSGL